VSHDDDDFDTDRKLMLDWLRTMILGIQRAMQRLDRISDRTRDISENGCGQRPG
jgi:hypothetical protein